MLLPAEGDLYEDGLTLRNGFFRSRRFAAQGSEAGSLELFSEERDSGDEGVEDTTSSQAEAKRRRDRLEREEFIRKCKVRPECAESEDCHVVDSGHLISYGMNSGDLFRKTTGILYFSVD